MVKKKLMLIISFVGTSALVFVANPVGTGLCESINYDCRELYSSLEAVLLVFPIMLLSVLFTLLFKRSTYQFWWQYARIAIPITLISLIAVSFEFHHATHGQWQDLFDEVFVASILTVFTLGSLIQLLRGYWAK